jgi:hypothetical protein
VAGVSSGVIVYVGVGVGVYVGCVGTDGSW